ncbi:MAG: serine--tRNA ligase [Acidobacteriaceae bacterium]
MLDLGFVRANLAEVKERLGRRGTDAAAMLDGFEALDRHRRTCIQSLENFKSERNDLTAQIGICKLNKVDVPDYQLERVRNLKKYIEGLAGGVAEAEQKMQAVLRQIPNLPAESVPSGTSADDNVEVRRWGAPRVFDFAPKPHWELGEQLGILNFEQAAKISGARFAVYWDAGARLERALANFMLDLHTGTHGYREVLPPFMVNEASLFGTGQLPKFAEDLFRCADRDYQFEGQMAADAVGESYEIDPNRARFNDHWMIPTAEVPLTNLYRDDILDEKQLPISVTAWTPCFRAEAGAYGKDVRGLVRQHQFQKVELVKFVTPEQSYAEHEKLTGHAEAILQALELPYRVMDLCAGDLGFSAAKTYDLEVWLPGQNVYREISSCSNFEAFQARRANIRYRPQGQKKTEFVHTLNGSGLAVGRTWLAIVENYQQADGSVAIPTALQPYMGGLKSIEPRSS